MFGSALVLGWAYVWIGFVRFHTPCMKCYWRSSGVTVHGVGGGTGRG